MAPTNFTTHPGPDVRPHILTYNSNLKNLLRSFLCQTSRTALSPKLGFDKGSLQVEEKETIQLDTQGSLSLR